MDGRLKVASVCRTLPTPAQPEDGLFVSRRLSAMGRKMNLSVIQPVPYFPLLRPLPGWARTESHEVEGTEIAHAPMFYLPAVLKRLDSFWLRRSVSRFISALKRRGELNLIDAHFAYPDGVGCIELAARLDVPVFVTFRGVEQDLLDDPAIAALMRRIIPKATGCICVSHSLREVAMQYDADPDGIAVIHNAVDRELYRPGDKLGARERLGVDATGKIIVAVGNLLSVKRHDTLIGALPGVLANNPDTRLVIVGGAMHEARHPGQLADLCRTLGIEDKVVFTGKLAAPTVADWLKAADVFALGSRREGCCNAVLEALASGLPVVTTPVGDNPWFVKDGINGTLVPVGDAEAMAARLDTALNADWDPQQISDGLTIGSWDDVATDILNFYRDRLDVRTTVSEIDRAAPIGH